MRRCLVVAGLFAATALFACREQTQQPTPPAAVPPTNAPADVSHGEAPIGSAAEPAPVDPAAPPRSNSHLRRFRVSIRHAKIAIADGVMYNAWTFDGRVPGPVLRVTEGDTVDFTLVNEAPMPHSLDFHAAEIAPSRAYVNLMPHDSLHYRFVARVPGAFMYHCGTAPVALHIANGMYRAIIVDPRSGRTPAREFVFVQSEFYTKTLPDSTRTIDWEKLLGLAPDYVVFNDGSLAHPLEGVQTVTVPVGGGAIFEARLVEAGTYPFVSHAFADATKGAVGMFKAR
jgi:nitrite reductase (NO-forming)